MTKRKHQVITEINLLKLPIFSSSSVKKQDNTITTEIDFTDNNREYNLEIKHYPLTSFDRKIMLACEYIYLKQNTNFERDTFRTTIKELSQTLGMTGNKNYTHIYKGLEKLQQVNIKANVITRDNNGNTMEQEGLRFNLLAYIKYNISKTKEKKRKYINYIEVGLNKFHIDNFRNHYYRKLNFSLMKSLHNPISVRLFDYLNYTCFYKEGDKYKQKTMVRIDYHDLVAYLHLQEQKELYLIKRQFKKPLEELKEKEIIKFYQFERTLFDETLLFLHLSKSINLWNKYNPSVEDIDQLIPLTPLQYKLIEHGLTEKQSIQIEKGYSEDYIQEKINQLEFLLNKLPNKVKGAGRYLYNSIIDDWKNVEYEKFKTDEATIENVTKNQIRKDYEREYTKYIRNACLDYYNNLSEEDRKKLDNEMVKEVNNDGKYNHKSLKSIGILEKRTQRIEEILCLPLFEEWMKEKCEITQ